MIIERKVCVHVFSGHTWYLVAKVTGGHLEHTPSAAFLLLLFPYPPPLPTGWKQHAIQLEAWWLAKSEKHVAPTKEEYSQKSWGEPVCAVLPWSKKNLIDCHVVIVHFLECELWCGEVSSALTVTVNIKIQKQGGHRVQCCKFLTEDDVFGQTVNDLSSQDVIGQLSVHLLLLLLPLKELSIRSGNINTM